MAVDARHQPGEGVAHREAAADEEGQIRREVGSREEPLGAQRRERLNQVLWGAVILVAIPVFLFYGGGGASTYGYRYAMDFVPFLVALVAIALHERFGNLERLLIGLSVAFVCYGFVWQVYK